MLSCLPRMEGSVDVLQAQPRLMLLGRFIPGLGPAVEHRLHGNLPLSHLPLVQLLLLLCFCRSRCCCSCCCRSSCCCCGFSCSCCCSCCCFFRNCYLLQLLLLLPPPWRYLRAWCCCCRSRRCFWCSCCRWNVRQLPSHQSARRRSRLLLQLGGCFGALAAHGLSESGVPTGRCPAAQPSEFSGGQRVLRYGRMGGRHMGECEGDTWARLGSVC